MESLTTTPITDALARARSHSPFLARQIDVYPELVALLLQGDAEAAWAAGRALEPDAAVDRRLRARRSGLALVAAIADLAGLWDLDIVTRRLSDFADEAIETALNAAFAERYPDEPPRGIAVIALGKHGSRELNYSSDIDPILIFDPQTIPTRGKEEPQEAALRLARRMVALLTERTGDGYVFRVDLRLRPSPEVSPIILPVEAAISYYESAAVGWEQAAFVRARAAAGDITLGEEFLSTIRPFVWRRSLDFGAIRAISDVSRRIRAHYASGQRFGPGFDLKRGRGGIREVEFFAQAHQLIQGGRNPALRAPATRAALRVLGEAGLIQPDERARLDAAYVMLRTIEHRLQMVDDRQTHMLPESPAALDNVAQLAGYADGAALLAALRPHVEATGLTFDGLVGEDEEGDDRLPDEPRALAQRLEDIGIEETEPFVARITRWRDGSLRPLRSAPAREALEELLPGLMRQIARAPAPLTALNKLDQVIEGLPTAVNLLRLLVARPALAETLVTILSHAPTLADALGRRAALFDGLIDQSALDLPPDVPTLIETMRTHDAGDDFQHRLDHVRHVVGERRFALGVQIVSREVDPLEVGRGYARVAEAAVDVLAAAAVAEFEQTHGRVPGSELAILALGRFGGGLLTHASDLDLIFLFSGDFNAESDGRRPLGATLYYNRLSQRVINALSVPTAAGALYEVDTRLRPSGNQGPLAVSFESFARYQAEAAWAWEHLALTRARPVFGSPSARAALDEIVRQTLMVERDLAQLLAQAVKMRRDIATHKPPAGPLDVKLMPGGLVDLEFLIHVTQLTHRTGFSPSLNIALEKLVAAGLLDDALREAADLLTRYLVVARLVAPQSSEPVEESRWLVARACGARDWGELLARIDAARQIIATSWNALAGQAAPSEGTT
ncbi:bifunctional [glutamine synthetase] adenylyltransferase/[glutamine synthetase]-adenylyl-L-tyrosine phosphorylase [Sphingobium sp. B11D3D]|uniref:bifunctional [glutamine synthetase] adenylyltransferase/[glutamine synthetase]-adenylyl-L-tyrosine phosphorylase n=1 Tax=Sphingobium sp. B11D3D TaxID=2940576 RepID=UPI0022243926|nr:bifunctional [glutamine synthetase] adenylyltransferase/[glutamine synthetase]-adenylyl-L-tyrosine phosphorylase [Sphingobium sp. B11D3D]MCW2370620.1 glutamate-ammonia-ligase adenylyltransferase [Sphingobium sp. B11D3D]